MLALNSVASVKATPENGVYLLDCNITDRDGFTYDCEYCSRPEDMFGLNPTIREWLVENEGSYQVVPYVPPTVEEMRATFPLLTSRQFWLAAANIGVTKALVASTIEALDVSDVEKATLMVELMESTTFERLHYAVVDLANALNIPAQQLDDLWMWGSAL
ncbi:hypothetical protein [Shinella zoogloeoides]|uniref:hypothetical protein n=1 Tax=Shinella zoogloeoides TaxID=352475 RepID=UPI00273F016F|nr:hypothetical protein [Shinella zoogloeoides]WLR91023.1 hypothetical protein Q9316_00310 [Shinella zoogloeoides]